MVVHDAARPLADVAVFDRVVAAVRAGADGAVPGVPIADTVKRVGPDGVVVDDDPARRAGRGADAAGVPGRRAARRARGRARRDRRRCGGRGGRRPGGGGRGPVDNFKITEPADLDAGGRGRRAPGGASGDPRRPGLRRPSVRCRRHARDRRCRRRRHARRSSVIPTPTSSPMPWPTRCSARPGCPTSAPCSRRRIRSTRAHRPSGCSPRSRARVAQRGLVDRQRRRRDRGRASEARTARRGHGCERGGGVGRRTPSRWVAASTSPSAPSRGEGLGFVGRAEGIQVWAVALLERA